MQKMNLRKLIISILVFLISIKANSQTFHGINISGKIENTIAQFKSRGYKLIKKIDNVAYQMTGFLANQEIEMYVHFTPLTKQTAMIVIYFPERTSYERLLEDYEEYYDLLSIKYGPATKRNQFFLPPYKEGDGDELSAIKSEMGFVGSYWLNINNLSLSISISKHAQLKITYENDKMTTKLQSENKAKLMSIL